MKTKFQGRSKENSHIFTGAESESIKKRISSRNYTDTTGAFTRASNKISEILSMTDTSQKRKRLYKIIEDKRFKKKKLEKAKPNDVKSFEDFSKTVGY